MTAFFKISPQFDVIVNFPVANDVDGSILVRDRLLSAIQINNRKSLHGKSNRTINIFAIAIGTTMKHELTHFVQDRWLNRGLIEVEDAEDAAHFNYLT